MLFLCRLVFLLQCSFKVLESCGGDGNSAVIPLTLGSAVRKFTKQTLRMDHSVTSCKQQVHFMLEVILKLIIRSYCIAKKPIRNPSLRKNDVLLLFSSFIVF